jgi:hypothetical protein
MARETPAILKAFATCYRDSKAGRTGGCATDYTLDLE